MSGLQAAMLLAHKAPTGGATAYRYFRLDISANNGATQIALNTLSLFVGATAYPIVAMTADDAPSPLVASASSEFSIDGAWRAFDASNNVWETTSGDVSGSWLKIDLGVGNEISPDSFAITSSLNATIAANNTPKTFTLSGSNDDSAYTQLAAPPNQTGWSASEKRTFSVP